MNTELFEEESTAFSEKRRYLQDFVLPDYDTLNLVNIRSLLSKLFNAGKLFPPKFPENYVDDRNGVEKVFFVIVDGLGLKRLVTHIRTHDGKLRELAVKGVLKPLTSTLPATTSTALTSIFTGLQPAEHGILGYQMFSSEYGCVFNTLDMKPIFGYSGHVDLARDFSKRLKPWMPSLQEHGVRTLIATKASIVGSGLSRIIHADQEFVPYMLDSEMMVKCKKVLEQQGPTLLMLYYSGVDAMEHRYGPKSEEVTSEIQSFESHLTSLISRLSANTKKETIIVLTADHGVVETTRVNYIKDHPDILNSLVLPPVGDSRATFLFGKPESKDSLRSSFERNVEGFRLLPSEQLVKAEAFGKSADKSLVEASVGDFAALSTSRSALQYPYFEEDRSREQHGAHGGMTAEEILVPLLSLRLSKV